MSMPIAYCDYHTHTTFSDGKNTVEEMVQAAIARGMPAIGISDHSDAPCDPSYCMKLPQYPAYLQEIARVKEKYADRITVLAGMELDADSDLAITAKLDYFLGSVHYLIFDGRVYAIDHARDIQQACIDNEFGGNRLAFARSYFAEVVRHVRRCRPTIIGHFDVITKFGLMDESDPAYQRIATEALEQAVAVTPVLEVNTGGIARGWRTHPYPSDFLLRRLHELGGQVVLGADAHAAETIDFFFPQAAELIRAAGFRSLLTLWPDGFREEKL